MQAGSKTVGRGPQPEPGGDQTSVANTKAGAQGTSAEALAKLTLSRALVAPRAPRARSADPSPRAQKQGAAASLAQGMACALLPASPQAPPASRSLVQPLCPPSVRSQGPCFSRGRHHGTRPYQNRVVR